MTLEALSELDFETRARHFDRVQRMTNSGSWEWDILTNGLTWSPQIFRIFGLSANAFAPTYPAFLERVHPDDRHIVEQGVHCAIEKIQPYAVDHRIVLPDGTVRIVHEIGEVEFAPDGTAVRMLGVVSDVTEARANAEALRAEIAEANRISVMAESLAGLGYWRYVPATATRTWSASTFAIFGLDPADGVPPQGGVGMFDPEDQVILRKSVQGVVTGHSPDYEYPITRVDGTRGYVRMIGALERDLEGGVSHMYGAIIDVTGAKLREQAISESEARYRLLAENISDIIVRYDAKGVIEYVSPSVRQLGYEPVEVIGRHASMFWSAERHPGEEALDRLARSLPLNKGRDNEFSLLRRDGEVIWVEGNPSTIRDEVGNVVAVVSILRNVTERRAMEDELRLKQAEAEAASVAKSEFLANMSHEIRTPLTGVLGFAHGLERLEDLSDKARTYVNRIVTSGRDLLLIVNDVLDFARLEAGEIALNPQPFELASFLDETLSTVLADAKRKGLAVDLQQRGVWPKAVCADAGRLRQVLLNLLGNGIKFTERGTVTLTCSAGQAGRLRFEVTDSGIGIGPEHVGRLFQRFSQVDGSNTRQYAGAGLGLAISKALVEAMGGEIGVESVAGEGSTFWFTVEVPVVVPSSAR